MITIQKADQTNFHMDSLDAFSRKQVVTDVYRLQDGQLRLVHQPFSEDWSAERKREKAAEILNGAYITFCAFEDGRVLGAIILTPELNEGRMIVHSFHVSADQRRRGLGRMLFAAAKDEARRHGAAALYISACSSEETINFYLAMGCQLSPRPIQAMVDDEPWDIQLECALDEQTTTPEKVIEEKKMSNTLTEMINNMISWAMDHLGDRRYAGWCLSFIEDALEISNDIEIFGGDCARESCEMYHDALCTGVPEKGAFVFYDCMCESEEGPVNWGHCGIALDDGKIIHAWDQVRIDDYLDMEKLTALTGDHPKYIGWVPVTRVLAEKN